MSFYDAQGQEKQWPTINQKFPESKEPEGAIPRLELAILAAVADADRIQTTGGDDVREVQQRRAWNSKEYLRARRPHSEA